MGIIVKQDVMFKSVRVSRGTLNRTYDGDGVGVGSGGSGYEGVFVFVGVNNGILKTLRSDW
mgnify:FL=1